jgi:glyoxylase-like metal-dependent hydrolase (beta-lactamase superfamily II)
MQGRGVKSITRLALVFAVCTAGSACFAPHVLAQTPVREILNVRGDLYRVREDDQFTVFLVTPDGIILGDPLNVPFARWLKDELAMRFPGLQVRYVLHSHHHFDRAEGASVFRDTADILAHQDFNNELSRARGGQIPRMFAGLDLNGNGIFERAELKDVTPAPLLAMKDRNGDGDVTPDELYRMVGFAKSTYDDRHTITLGGKTVQLIHAGGVHALDMTLLHFPFERVVFAVDHPPVASVPFSFAQFTVKEVVEWVRILAPLDFDTLVSGAGDPVTRAEITDLNQYLNDLVAGVAVGYGRRDTVDEIVRSSMLSQYQNTPRYSTSSAHIISVYRALRLTATDVYVVGLRNYAGSNATICRGLHPCEPVGGTTAAAALGLAISGRDFGVAAEWRTAGQFTGSIARVDAEQSVARRETLFSFLFRYSPALTRRLALSFVAGPAVVVSDTRGFLLVKKGVVADPRAQPFEQHRTQFGYGGGVDLQWSIGDRVGLIFPARLTQVSRGPYDWLGSRDGHVGIGVTVRVFENIRVR